MTVRKIDYNQDTKKFFVKLNNGHKYEKETVNELTKELSAMGVKWKLTRAARKQVESFKMI